MGWLELKREVERKRETDLKKIAGQIMSGERLDPEDLAEIRGYWKATKWMLSKPEQAAQSLKAAQK